MTRTDPFDEAYATGIDSALPRARSNGADRPATAMPVAPVALGGAVLRPDHAMTKGWVVVEADRIVDIRTKKPSGVTCIDTGGVILPGLIDLHGHPEYNVFSPWEPPKTFINRGQWRDSSEYDALVKQPWHRLTSGGKSKSIKAAMARYAETRAAVGGVTAIQGASKHYPKKVEALVRNVDLFVFGAQIARSTIDAGRLMADEADRIKQGIADGTVKAHYVHLAEGQKSNAASVSEFTSFAASGLLTQATVMIHGTALTRSHFDDLAAAGGKLVWSPQSNLRLYAETTDVKAALDAKVPLALGADWLPSGSPSLLHEMKVAQRVLAEQAPEVTSKQLVHMVTAGAAQIAGLGDELGQLEINRPADLVVLQRQHDDPYDAVVGAYPSSVELVMIGGDIIYGRPDWVGQVTAVGEYEPCEAWGRSMALDTRLGSPTDETPAEPPRRLADMRRQLIRRYPAVGPIFA